MRDRINFGVVNSEDAYNGLQDFAKSFNHGEPMTLPIVTINKGQRMIGYYTQILQPVIVPSFHPELTTARDFQESLNVIVGAQHLSSISPAYPHGVCYAATRNKVINKSIFEKLGFNKLDVDLYINVGGK